MKKLFFDFTSEDYEDYLRFAQTFYNSDSVLHTVPGKNFEDAFKLIMQKNPYLRGLMIKEGEKNIGYALLAFSYSVEAGGLELWLEELYLSPAFRRKGYAKAFFQYIHLHYAEKVAQIRLEVVPEKQWLIDLYVSLGYEILPYVQMNQSFSPTS